MVDKRACGHCHGVHAVESSCIPSPRLTKQRNAGVRSWIQWLKLVLLDDFVSFLYQCDVCQGYFCNDCAAEILGELRFCPSCTGTAPAMKIVLDDPMLQKDPVVWRHVGNMLNPGERVDVALAHQSAIATVTVSEDGGVKPLPPTAVIVKSYSKADCLAKALELSPTRRYWPELAAAMEWSDSVYIVVTSASAGGGGGTATPGGMSFAASVPRKKSTLDDKAPLVPATLRQRSSTSIGDNSVSGGGAAKKLLYQLSCRDVFITAIHIDPTDAVTWANLAIALPDAEVISFGGQSFSKRDCFERAIMLKEKNESLLVSYAIWLYQCEQRAQQQTALTSERESSALDSPSSHMEMRERSHTTAGNRSIFTPIGSTATAKRRSILSEDGVQCRRLLRLALQCNPMSGSAWSALATVLHDGETVDVGAAGIQSTRLICDGGEQARSGLVGKIAALRMAATLLLTEESIFSLAMGLKSQQHPLMLSHPVFDGQESVAVVNDGTDGNPQHHKKRTKQYPLTRSSVLAELASLHIKFPKRFPLSSAKMSFAITTACPTAGDVLQINSRFLISGQHFEDRNLTPDTPQRLTSEEWKCNRHIQCRLSAPCVVRRGEQQFKRDDLTLSLRIRFVVDGSDYLRDDDLCKQCLIGEGTQGVVLKAIKRDPATEILTPLAVKAFLYVPPMQVDDAAESMTVQETFFEELIGVSGDLKFLLSEKTAGITVTGRHAVAFDLTDGKVFATKEANGAYTPGKFVTQGDDSTNAPEMEVVLEPGSPPVVLHPKPYLVMIFMDRALMSLNRRCTAQKSSYHSLPVRLVPKVLGLADDGSDAYRNDVEVATSSVCRFLLEREVKYYMREIVAHIHRLHTKGYAHRDVKPENVLLLPNGDVRLADFGVVGRDHRKGGGADHQSRENEGYGTYLAPEDLPESKYHKTSGGHSSRSIFGKDDVWAIGQTLRYLLTSIVPHKTDPQDPNESNACEEDRGKEGDLVASPTAVYRQRQRGSKGSTVRKDLISLTVDRRAALVKKFNRHDQIVSLTCLQFLERCLCQCPQERASCSELLRMPFLETMADLAVTE